MMNVKELVSFNASLVVQQWWIFLPMQETQIQFLGHENPLQNKTATHSSILAWEIQGTKEPDRLQSVGSDTI